MQKHLLITICARGGSKGIPKKNIRLLAGKPLIEYTYNHAVKFAEWLIEHYQISTEIALSTDSEEIKSVCGSFGFHSNYIRPDFLASDSAGKLDAVKDIIEYQENLSKISFNYILDLDVSAPMRTIEDLQEGFKEFYNDISVDNTYSVSTAHKNPYFNMVEEEEDGYFRLSKKREAVLSRQKAPLVYEMNASFYFYRRQFYNIKPLYLFNRSKAFVMHHLSFDLDHINDFDYLEFLVKENKLPFKF